MERETKIAQALRFVDEEGYTANAAAKKVGVTPSGVYSALERRKLRALAGVQACPCCGKTAPRSEMNEEVLTAAARKSLR